MDQLRDIWESARDKFDKVTDKADDVKDIAVEKAVQAKDFISDKAEDAKDIASEKIAEIKRDIDLHRFNPITEEQLKTELETMPEIIRFVDWDDRTEEDVCKDAVAFNDGTKEMRAISVLVKYAGLINASFYPDKREGIFYRDPRNPYLYIELDEYFDYLKKAKIHELNQIAQDLGAKHIKISLMEEKKTFVQKKDEKKVNAGNIAKVKRERSEKATELESIEVFSDKTFKGHKPQKPELNYFKNEPDILNIIDRRMDEYNPICKDKEVFKYINSSGIRKEDVAEIEGVLKKFKTKIDVSISDKVENEEKRFFEYQIEYPEEE